MVEVGELSIFATMNTASVDAGFDRIVDQLKEMDIQSKQLGATTSSITSIFKKLTKTVIGFGLAGAAAITALAVKSPVLAGTMAKLGVNMLKLSNVVGRQFKPIFEEIAQNLIPSITKAFADNEQGIGKFVDNTVLLVKALSDLIALDYEGLLNNLDKLFKPENLPELEPGQTQESLSKTDPFRESRQTIKNLFDEGPNQLSLIPPMNPHAMVKFNERFAQLIVNVIVDSYQHFNNQENKKNSALINATGVTR